MMLRCQVNCLCALIQFLVLSGIGSSQICAASPKLTTFPAIFVNPTDTTKGAFFSFIFDDGLPSDSAVVQKFHSIGWKAGFALITNKVTPQERELYLSYQQKGFEILSHSENHPRFGAQSALTQEESLRNIRNSRDSLRAWGFHVTGWVTPFSQMQEQFINILESHYRYGFTRYFGAVTAENVQNSYHVSVQEHRLWRVSLEASSAADIKLAISRCVSEKGLMVFYAHRFPSSTIPLEKMNEIMRHLANYVDRGEAEVLAPGDAVSRFTVR